MLRTAGPLLALLLGFALPAHAERVVLIEGRTARAWLGFEIRQGRTENTAPEVIGTSAGAVFGELRFVARSPGRSTVTVRDALGEKTASFEVDVLSKHLDGERRVLEGLPDSVRVSADGPYVLVEGTVTSAAEMAQIDALAAQIPNLHVDVRYVEKPVTPAQIASTRIEQRLRSEWRGAGERRAPDLAPADSASFERWSVTLLPGTFVLAPHPFRIASSSQSDGEVMQATTEERRTLFVGLAPGTALYVARDAEDRRWIVFDVTVLDPATEGIQRAAPPLPRAVRVSLQEGRIVLQGTVVSPEDIGAVEVVSAMFPEVENLVQTKSPLPEP